MAKIIMKDDRFITTTSDWMGSTRYHIPGLLQTCTSIDYIFSNVLMTLIWLLTSLIDHSSFNKWSPVNLILWHRKAEHHKAQDEIKL